MSVPLRIYTLGGLTIQKGEEVVTGLETRKVEALLVYLASTRRAHPREQLAEWFWEGRPQAQSLVNLRVALASLRKHLGEYLEISRESVGLRPDTEVWLDAAAMEKKLDILSGGQKLKNAETAEELDRAIELYHGEFLEGFYVRDCPWFEGWQRRERERLHGLVVSALHVLVAYFLNRGDITEGLTRAARLLELDPLMESTHRQMMQLLALSGKRALALKQYEILQRTLDRELGVDPEVESRRLYEDIHAGRFPAPNERPGAPPQMDSQPRHNLPPSLTQFLGRERELAEVTALLEDPGCRLVTLVGPGGIGKTRLAIRAAENLLPAFPQGAWFVPLDSLASPEFLVEAIGAALDLSFSGQIPPREQLLESLRRKELLLVLDNFEHLLPGGTELLVEILHKAPGVKLLVTSRQRLNLQAEWVLEVHGLDYPKNGDNGDLEGYPAAALFLQHARRAAGISLLDQDRVCVAHITRLVEGMPLALELAAAWVRALSCGEIAAEIERGLGFLQARQPDLPERHHSMQAVFAHSWRLLSDEERSVFRRLAVFRGGFDREAAGQVAGASLAVLAALVDKSLIHHRTDGRYRIHELLRQFAEAELEVAGETSSTRERHLAYFLDLAEQSGPELWRDQEKVWLDMLESEHDNLRPALEWSLSPLSGLGVQAGLRLVVAIELFWWSRGYSNEAVGWLAVLLAHPQAADDPKVYASGLVLAAILKEWATNEVEAARVGYERSLAIAETAGDPLVLAHVLSDFGNFHMNRGDLAVAQIYIDRSLALYRELENEPGIGTALRRMGHVSSRKHDIPTARSYYQQSLQIWKSLGNRSNMAKTLIELGRSYLYATGQHAEAQAALDESLTLSREVNDKWGVVNTLYERGWLEFNSGEIDRAINFLEDSLRMFRDQGLKADIAWPLADLGIIARYQEAYPKALSFFQEALAIFQEIGHEMGQHYVLVNEGFLFFRQGDGVRALELFKESLVLSWGNSTGTLNRGKSFGTLNRPMAIIGLSGLSTLDGNPERAARLLGAAEAWIESKSIPFTGLRAEYAEYERILAKVRTQFDEDTFNRLSNEGRALAAEGLDQVLAYALENI